MTTVTAKELKEHSADVIGRVRYGNERVGITHRGKMVAVVVSLEDAHLLEELEDVLDIHDALQAIEEADRIGTVSLDALREKLGH